MDAIDSVVDPLRDFAKDSVRLVKRCHKPDRKGISLSFSLSLSLSQYIYICGFCLDLCGSGTEIRVFCCRIHESGVPYSDRIRGDGIRRLLREADLHSDQQHHRRLRLGILLRNLISIAVFLFHRKFKSTCT